MNKTQAKEKIIKSLLKVRRWLEGRQSAECDTARQAINAAVFGQDFDTLVSAVDVTLESLRLIRQSIRRDQLIALLEQMPREYTEKWSN